MLSVVWLSVGSAGLWSPTTTSSGGSDSSVDLLCWDADGGHQCREMRTRTSDRKHNVFHQALPAAPPPWHRDCMDRPMLVAMPWEIPANHPIVNHGSTASPSFGPGSFGK